MRYSNVPSYVCTEMKLFGYQKCLLHRMELFGNQKCQVTFAQKWNYLVIKGVKLLCTAMELFGNQKCQVTFAQKWNYLVIKSVKLLLQRNGIIL